MERFYGQNLNKFLLEHDSYLSGYRDHLLATGEGCLTNQAPSITFAYAFPRPLRSTFLSNKFLRIPSHDYCEPFGFFRFIREIPGDLAHIQETSFEQGHPTLGYYAETLVEKNSEKNECQRLFLTSVGATLFHPYYDDAMYDVDQWGSIILEKGIEFEQRPVWFNTDYNFN